MGSGGIGSGGMGDGGVEIGEWWWNGEWWLNKGWCILLVFHSIVLVLTLESKERERKNCFGAF